MTNQFYRTDSPWAPVPSFTQSMRSDTNARPEPHDPERVECVKGGRLFDPGGRIAPPMGDVTGVINSGCDINSLETTEPIPSITVPMQCEQNQCNLFLADGGNSPRKFVEHLKTEIDVSGI